MFLHISRSVQAPTYERMEQLCRGCGKVFQGNHWTKPPCASQRLEWIFEGRILGWCGPCITAEEERRAQMDAMMRRERTRPVDSLARPRRTVRDDDQPPF